MDMDIEVEVIKCECCGLKEECTVEYIDGVKSRFNGRWLCGLCCEAVKDEVERSWSVEEAVKSHASFCRKSKLSPAFRVAEGMREMLIRSRRRSLPLLPSTAKSTSRSQLRDVSSLYV